MVERYLVVLSKLCFSLNNSLLLLIAVSCIPLLVACGSSGDGERVHGTVTVDGKPAENGSISFKFLGKDSSICGAEIREGKYEAIVPLGKSKVEIRVPEVIGQEKMYDTADSPVMDVTRESLPAKYNVKTELEIDVVAGANNKDWKLDGKRKRK